MWWEDVLYSFAGERAIHIKDLKGLFWAEVDAVIVTPTFALEKVRNQLKKKIKASVISLEDLVYDM